MSKTMHTLSESIAEWAYELKLNVIPREVINQVKMALVDTLSVAVSGSLTPVADVLRKSVLAFSTRSGATIIGDFQSVYPAEIAAQVNSSFAHALDFDDNSYAGFVHASAIIIPAALAISQETGASGEDFLVAVIAGLESELLVGEMTHGLLYKKGWWTTGVLGAIGATVASSRLLGLTQKQISNAIGLAVSGTGGIKACFGTDAKPLLAGMTSANAMRHVKLAKLGATGPLNVFESENGFFNLFNEGVSDILGKNQLGSDWKIIEPGLDIKEIPVCLSSHAAVEAVRALKKEFHFNAQQVKSVVCDVPPIVIENLIYELPETPQEAQFSLTFPIAVTLIYDRFLLKHLAREVILNPVTTSLMKKVSMYSSAAWHSERIKKYPEGADIEIHLTNGTIMKQFVGMPQGSREKSKRWEMLVEKVADCMAEVVLDADRDEFIQKIREIETLKHIGQVLPQMNHPSYVAKRNG
jgi:2-methylcitrate dehydratase PrpD|tara:strand:- start:204 stop:1610 length:1407 start_codon:yes stop_codon:yes gene_type:complete